jgi:hypothetical protein
LYALAAFGGSGFHSPRSLRSHGSLHPQFGGPGNATHFRIRAAKPSHSTGTLGDIFALTLFKDNIKIKTIETNLMIKLEVLEKNNFNKFSKKIFSILANNMSVIAPTGNTYEDDYNEWSKAIGETLKKETRNIIIIYFDDILVGFFQYYTTSDGLFMMEEIQILPIYQGKKYNIFRKLYGFVFSILPKNIKKVEAFANKKNYKSQRILNHLGLHIIGNNKNGKSHHYQGSFKSLMKWYNNDIS